MRHNFEKQYKNVLIRQLQKEDIELIRKWRNEPKNTTYLSHIPFITAEMQAKWYEKYLDNADEMTFAIVENSQLNSVVGSLSLYNFEKNKVEFGKILIGNENAHGKSVGVNAIKAVLWIAFNELKMKQVYLHVYKNNRSACKVYEKVGFKIQTCNTLNGMTELVMYIDHEMFLMEV